MRRDARYCYINRTTYALLEVGSQVAHVRVPAMPRLKAHMLRLHVHCDIAYGDMDIITSPHRVFMKEV